MKKKKLAFALRESFNQRLYSSPSHSQRMPLPPAALSRSVALACPLARRGTSGAKKQQAPSLCRRCRSLLQTMPPNKPTAAGANAAAAASNGGGTSAEAGGSKKSQDEHTAADYYFDSYSHFGKERKG